MPKIRHQVEHDGLTFTRTSASRTYRYAVLTPVSLAKALATAELGVAYDLAHNRDFHECAARGEPSKGYSYTVDDELRARSAAWLAKPEAEHLAEARARATGYWREAHGERAESWECRGWCSRLDLAQKLAEPGDAIVAATIL